MHGIVERLLELRLADGASISTCAGGIAHFDVALGADEPLQGLTYPLDDTLGAECVRTGELHVLRGSEGADMGQNALSLTLGRLEEPAARPAPQPQPPAQLGFELPHALQGYRLGNWRWLAPGIRLIRILPLRAGRSSLNLLRVSPGVAMPCHGHAGLELSCILTGSYVDEFGHFGPGDLAEMDGDVDHMPVADPRDGCICLIAADGKLQFRSLLPRLLRPVLGF